MSAGIVIVAVVAGLVVIVAAAIVASVQNQRRLRRRFGPEYDRLVEEHGSKRAAAGELARRKERAEKLDIRPLSEEKRRHYSAQWEAIQADFVDRPREALQAASALLISVMNDRGYPTEDYGQIQADLSVDHARTLGRLRKAHDISARADSDSTSTEDLRQSMVHYGAVFEDLVGAGADGDRAPDRAGPGKGTTADNEQPMADAPEGEVADEPARQAEPSDRSARR